MPKNVGRSIWSDVRSPTTVTSQSWPKSHVLVAAENARVVTARNRPRMRSAGSPMRSAATAPARTL
jgi:hypothetical protein